MTKIEIIDNLLTNLTVRETLNSGFDLEKGQDRLLNLFGPRKDNTIIGALLFLKDHKGSITLAHAEWIERLGL